MLSNLIGFDIGAEVRCLKTQCWIRKEERAVKRLEKRRKLEPELKTNYEADSEDATVSIEEIFQRAIETVQKEQEERKQKEEEERKAQEERERTWE